MAVKKKTPTKRKRTTDHDVEPQSPAKKARHPAETSIDEQLINLAKKMPPEAVTKNNFYVETETGLGLEQLTNTTLSDYGIGRILKIRNKSEFKICISDRTRFNLFLSLATDKNLTVYSQHPPEEYLENQYQYLSEVLIIDESIAICLGITHTQYFLATHLFQIIYNNDLERFEEYMNGENLVNSIETSSFVLEKNDEGKFEISHTDKQENVTPLMLACALGRKEMVMALISAGANIHRCGLHSGQNACFALLRGKAKISDMKVLTQLFLQNGLDMNVVDHDNHNLLHYVLELEKTLLEKKSHKTQAKMKRNKKISVELDYQISQIQVDSGNQDVFTLEDIDAWASFNDNEPAQTSATTLFNSPLTLFGTQTQGIRQEDNTQPSIPLGNWEDIMDSNTTWMNLSCDEQEIGSPEEVEDENDIHTNRYI